MTDSESLKLIIRYNVKVDTTITTHTSTLRYFLNNHLTNHLKNLLSKIFQNKMEYLEICGCLSNLYYISSKSLNPIKEGHLGKSLLPTLM